MGFCVKKVTEECVLETAFAESERSRRIEVKSDAVTANFSVCVRGALHLAQSFMNWCKAAEPLHLSQRPILDVAAP